MWNRGSPVGAWDPTKPRRARPGGAAHARIPGGARSQPQGQADGGFFDWRGASCRGFGMPLVMYAFQPMEFIVTPETTYVLVDWVEHTRRIYTDGRDWPKEIEPTLMGYSIGKWLDTDGDGRFDTLEVESRGFKGPRHYDSSGTAAPP